MSKMSKWSTQKKVGVSVLAAALVVVVFIVAFNVAPNNSGVYAKDGVMLLPNKYNDHFVVKTTDAPLITENKLPVFNDTLLDFSAVPIQMKIMFKTGENGELSETGMFEFDKVKYDEAKLSHELGDLPLYDKDGKSVIFYQWNPSGPQAGNQYLFKNAADGFWYLIRWPQYLGQVDDYLNTISTYAE